MVVSTCGTMLFAFPVSPVSPVPPSLPFPSPRFPGGKGAGGFFSGHGDEVIGDRRGE